MKIAKHNWILNFEWHRPIILFWARLFQCVCVCVQLYECKSVSLPLKPCYKQSKKNSRGHDFVFLTVVFPPSSYSSEMDPFTDGGNSTWAQRCRAPSSTPSSFSRHALSVCLVESPTSGTLSFKSVTECVVCMWLSRTFMQCCGYTHGKHVVNCVFVCVRESLIRPVFND